LTIDGVGEWATCSISHGENGQIKVLKELHFPHSLGLLYSAFTYFLGFKVNSGEYKLMGLAPYGNASSTAVQSFIEKIKNNLVDIKSDGSLWLNQKYFDYATGLRMINVKKWEQLFEFNLRNPDEELTQIHCDLAYSIQAVTEEIVLNLAQEAKNLTGSANLCLAGGVALNCVANGKISQAGYFNKIFIQPAAGDAGGSLGAALAAYHIYYSKEYKPNSGTDGMHGGYLGPEYSNIDIQQMARKYNAKFRSFSNNKELCQSVAALLDDGSIVGWMNGRMEFGPRALGNRSILGDPRREEMQKRLNLKIKYRESFRPVAPSVLAEDAAFYFEIDHYSPYMLMVQPLRAPFRNKLPIEFNEMSLRDKLYTPRSSLPAITHLDFTARIQTVHKETNAIFHELLTCFKQTTGVGMLVNTSFNVRGEPIVCTPEDAYRCFMRTDMDYLVINNQLFDKNLQPEWQSKDNWKEEFTLD
ncbi:MAG: carbamoyltransferase C-terminal domain-containing protein, partial [Cyclobacteriaceae bacterium]